MNYFKYIIQKNKLSNGNITGGGKIIWILKKAQYVFSFINDKTGITEIHLLKKKFKAFLQLEKFAAKLKTQENLI